ncbi:MAG: GNAT family N-acetyltransferase [Pseudomonadota bacterium]
MPTLVDLLGDDTLGKHREDSRRPLNPAYRSAFEKIDADPNNELIVAEHRGQIVGMMQLTFIPYLTHIGSSRCLIEGVRVSDNHRRTGLGRTLIERAIARAREAGCRIVQLTTDKKRPDALSFYTALGFSNTHEGLKLQLKS